MEPSNVTFGKLEKPIEAKLEVCLRLFSIKVKVKSCLLNVSPLCWDCVRKVWILESP